MGGCTAPRFSPHSTGDPGKAVAAHQSGRIDAHRHVVDGVHVEVHVGVLPVGEANETCERNDVAGLEGRDVLHELAHHALARLLFAAGVVGVPGPAGDGELVEKHIDC